MDHRLAPPHMTSRHRMIRHDGPRAVPRAYTRVELGRRLAAAAGVAGIARRQAVPFRMIARDAQGRALR